MSGVFEKIEQFENAHPDFRFDKGLQFYRQRLAFESGDVVGDLEQTLALTEERKKTLALSKDNQRKQLMDSFSL